jgi:hypothetical protein
MSAQPLDPLEWTYDGPLFVSAKSLSSLFYTSCYLRGGIEISTTGTLTIAYILPCSANTQSRAIHLPNTTFSRESKEYFRLERDKAVLLAMIIRVEDVLEHSLMGSYTTKGKEDSQNST